MESWAERVEAEAPMSCSVVGQLKVIGRCEGRTASDAEKRNKGERTEQLPLFCRHDDVC